MGRTLRIQQPGACYHVFNRGARRQATFVDDIDRSTFVTLLGAAARRFSFEFHAWCLMGNHYHLLLRTQKPNLAQGMHWVLSSYTRTFNRRHDFDGPLFRGRYEANVVGDDRQFLAESRYIHRNPIDAGLVTELAAYPYSSYPTYLGRVRCPRWLRTDLTLGFFGGEVAAYVGFVETDLHPASVAGCFDVEAGAPSAAADAPRTMPEHVRRAC